MFEIAPQELLEQIRYEFDLDFVPVPIRTLEELLRALTRAGSNLGPWVDELWEEYQIYDCILALDASGSVHRFIRTVTVLVVRDRVIKEDSDGVITKRTIREYLKESIEWPDGRTTERPYNNTLSEKWRWCVELKWIILARNWRKVVRRAVEEELGVWLTQKYTLSPWLQRFTESVRYFKDPETGTKGKLHVKADDPKRPGVTTHNHLQHAFLKLHERFWKASYREEKLRKGILWKTMVHRWASTSASLEQQTQERQCLTEQGEMT